MQRMDKKSVFLLRFSHVIMFSNNLSRVNDSFSKSARAGSHILHVSCDHLAQNARQRCPSVDTKPFGADDPFSVIP